MRNLNKDICIQVSHLKQVGGETFIEADKGALSAICQNCKFKTSIQKGFANFIFPNNGKQYDFSNKSFEVGFELRDCFLARGLFKDLGDVIPDSVSLQIKSYKKLEQHKAAKIKLLIFLSEDSPYSMESNDLKTAIQFVKKAFLKANIDLQVVKSYQFKAVSKKYTFSKSKHNSLENLYEKQGDKIAGDEIPVFFLPCIEETLSQNKGQRELEGLVLRIPGAKPPLGFADGVFIRDSHCNDSQKGPYWISGESLGKVWLHELGHYLGLFHSEEESGEKDNLVDTDSQNIMHFSPLEVKGETFSPLQLEIVRNHPSVLY